MPRPIPAGRESISPQTRLYRLQNTHLLIQAPCAFALALHLPPSPIPDLTRTSRARPPNPAALAFVPFGIVLVRVRVRCGGERPLARWQAGGRLNEQFLKLIDYFASMSGSTEARRAFTIFSLQRIHLASQRGVAQLIRAQEPIPDGPCFLPPRGLLDLGTLSRVSHGKMLHAFNESFRERAQPKRSSVLNTGLCEIKLREPLLLVFVPNKRPPQLQRLFFFGFGQWPALRPRPSGTFRSHSSHSFCSDATVASRES